MYFTAHVDCWIRRTLALKRDRLECSAQIDTYRGCCVLPLTNRDAPLLQVAMKSSAVRYRCPQQAPNWEVAGIRPHLYEAVVTARWQRS
eukprot:1487405-Amphidinium_carterae.1